MTYEYDPDLGAFVDGRRILGSLLPGTDLSRVRWRVTDDNDQEIVDGDAPDRPPEPTDPQDDETPKNDEVPET